jgi:1,4-dihydroxy-6-naphthoate synthase
MTKTITIYHSPDADDAFMFYGLTKGAVSVPGYEFKHDLSDIESLNHRALKGDVEVTAISVFAYPFLKDRYAILTCGASMGEESYGPRLIANKPLTLTKGKKYTIAVPGTYTSTTLACKLFLAREGIEAELITMNFDEIQSAVKEGQIELGAIIHEGQITCEREGFEIVLDLGSWWWKRHQLPLPLGVNIVRKDIGADAMNAVWKVLKGSIDYSLAHRKDAIQYALTYGRGISEAEADTFIGMYVNRRTLDLGDEGKRSIEIFLKEGREQGLVPDFGEIQFIAQP